MKRKTENKKYRGWLKWMLCLSVFLFAVSDAAIASNTALRIGNTLPSITLITLKEAKPVNIPGDYKGKILVLHFWQVGCSSCRFEMHDMDDLYIKYREKGLEVVAVNIGQQEKVLRDFLPKLKISYPVLLDIEKKSAVLYGVKDLPRTYIIDRTGVIRYRILGGASHKLLNKMILSLI